MTERSARLPGLRAARVARGWSQQRLADEAGVNRDSISRMETGQSGAYPLTVGKLAAALGVEPAELAGEVAG